MKSCHASCHHRHRLLELRSASRFGFWLTSADFAPRNSSRICPLLLATTTATAATPTTRDEAPSARVSDRRRSGVALVARAPK